MSRQAIVDEMISFIEEQERDLQVEKLSSASTSTKSDVVNSILKELEKKVSNENQNN